MAIHRGDHHDFLTRHRRQCERYRKKGAAATAELVGQLLYRIGDTRALKAAWDYLSEEGGQSPGPDGLRYSDRDDKEAWADCRAISWTIRAGQYEPFPEKVAMISKGPGRGTRPLVLQSILDRVAHRACVEILQPVLDPSFDPRSFGYRPGPGRSCQDALAVAESLAREEGRWIWVCADIKNAFGSVPLKRLLGIVRKKLPDDGLEAFIAKLLAGSEVKGLRQGSPLSPLLLNLYLHHLLDAKWRVLFPCIPLIRWADDILLLCESKAVATVAYAALAKLLGPTGMRLKESEKEAVRDLGAKQVADWMGFRIGKDGDRLRVRLRGLAWDGLAESLRLARDEDEALLHAMWAFLGWVASYGPCYQGLDLGHAQARISRIARDAGFEHGPGLEKVQRPWQLAWARWKKARKAAKKHPALARAPGHPPLAREEEAGRGGVHGIGPASPAPNGRPSRIDIPQVARRRRQRMMNEPDPVERRGGLRSVAARCAKLLIRARWKGQPGFVAPAALSAWGLDGIKRDPVPAHALVEQAADALDALAARFLPCWASGGVPADWDDSTPAGRVQTLVFGLVRHDDEQSCLGQPLRAAATMLRAGESADWADLADWSLLPELRRCLDGLPEPTAQSEEQDARLARMEDALRSLVLRDQAKDHYSTDEFAQMVGKAEYTVREWCRAGRIAAGKRGSGRGSHKGWSIPHQELLRYQRDGLLPLRPPARQG
ncbi:MAG: helix-turn-helix domain-containing protein [Gemmataceae bacterium]|nr:helix-turn-helix domain-containing protein [Gemmataceae bacterium]